jgi:hypothetical protein
VHHLHHHGGGKKILGGENGGGMSREQIETIILNQHQQAHPDAFAPAIDQKVLNQEIDAYIKDHGLSTKGTAHHPVSGINKTQVSKSHHAPSSRISHKTVPETKSATPVELKHSTAHAKIKLTEAPPLKVPKVPDMHLNPVHAIGKHAVESPSTVNHESVGEADVYNSRELARLAEIAKAKPEAPASASVLSDDWFRTHTAPGQINQAIIEAAKQSPDQARAAATVIASHIFQNSDQMSTRSAVAELIRSVRYLKPDMKLAEGLLNSATPGPKAYLLNDGRFAIFGGGELLSQAANPEQLHVAQALASRTGQDVSVKLLGARYDVIHPDGSVSHMRDTWWRKVDPPIIMNAVLAVPTP